MANLRRWLFALLPVLIIVVLVFNRVQAKAADEARIEQEQQTRRGAPAAVEIAVAQSIPIIDTLEIVGTVEAPFTVNLSPRVAGRITYLEVREGDEVQPGQVLARIDPSEANARALESRASLSESRSRLAQAEATVQSNEVQIEQNVRQVQAEVAAAQAALTQTQKSLEGRLAAAEAAVKRSEAALNVAEAEVKNRQAELTAAKASLANTQTRFARIQSQYEKGYIAAQEVDDARAEVAVAQANVNVRQGQIESAQASVTSARAQLESDRTTRATTASSGQAEVAAAQSRIDQAKASLAQAEANRAQSPAYRANVEALRSGVNAAEAQLRVSDVQVSDTELRSSVAGTVTARNGDPGSLATPGQPVLQVEFLDWLYINASVPLEQSSRVTKGKPVTIRIDGLDEQDFTGQVDEVVPSANAQDRQFTVRIRVENPDRTIRPGMFARLSIELDRFDARVVIPQEAVEGNQVTILDEEDQAQTLEVVLGKVGGNLVEVVQGLDIGDRVVILSYNTVRPGSKVNITAERLSDGSRRLISPENENDTPQQGNP